MSALLIVGTLVLVATALPAAAGASMIEHFRHFRYAVSAHKLALLL